LPVAKAFKLEAEQQEHGQEALHARIAKTQSAGALTLVLITLCKMTPCLWKI
jgi:hypothetical protein